MSADPAVRKQAESSLEVFSKSLDYVSQCQAILQGSSSPYAHMMVASSLLTLVTEQPTTKDMKLELRAFLLDAIFAKGPSMEAWVVTKMCTLLARITKLGWFEDDAHHTVVEDATKFIESGSMAHVLLGFRFLAVMVSEANHATPNRTLTEHRKTAVSFRDHCLFKIFQLAIKYLRDLRAAGSPQPAMQEALVSPHHHLHLGHHFVVSTPYLLCHCAPCSPSMLGHLAS